MFINNQKAYRKPQGVWVQIRGSHSYSGLVQVLKSEAGPSEEGI